MDARPDVGGSDGSAGEAPAVPVSRRLQLEVALLGTPAEPPAEAAEGRRQGGEPSSSVLVVVREPDMRGYVRECLREGTHLRIQEAGGGETALEAAERLAPDLVITELSLLSPRATEVEGGELVSEWVASAGAPVARVPLILIADEPPEDAVGWPTPNEWPRARVAFLLQPFNARRLIGEVERMLKRTGGV